MKKIMIILIMSAFVSMTSSAFALQIGDGDANTTGLMIGLVMFQPSPGVFFFTNATDVAYSVAAKHTGGDMAYTSTQAEPGITPVQSAKGTDITAANVPGYVAPVVP